MLRVTINGKPYEFAEDLSILEALRAEEIEVPTLCYDERLEAYGGCRLCVVRVEGSARPTAACTTPLADGIVIETHTPEIENERRTLLRLLARNYPAESVDRFPGKEFHRYLLAYGLEDALRQEPTPSLFDATHPYIQVDMARCVYCYRCVRICEEVQGQFVWQTWQRGDDTRILPDSRTTLLASSCVSCGACVDTCPTGALEDKTVLSFGVPTTWTRTTCPYCGVGCEMVVGARDGRIAEIKPALDAPVNRGHLCVKGRYACEYVYAPDRVAGPMIRENGPWKQVSWEEAINFTAKQLQRIKAQYGPDSIGVLGSSRATNEDNYLAQKFARIVLGTNNVDCCARVCHAPTAAAMALMLGTGAATNSFADVEKARTILVCGANPTENHPIVGARIKQAVLHGARLIVIDPRRIELSQYANYHLALRPGTNIPLLNAMAFTIVEEKLYDAEFMQGRVEDWERFQEFIQRWSPEDVAETCGVESELIRQAARMYATHKPAMSLHGLGMTEHSQGTEGVMCLVNLALLTGNMGKLGTGVNPLRGQNNVQGAAHMGCEPGHLTGFVPLEKGKGLFEEVWKTALPSQKGLNLLEMMDTAIAGKLKALWAIGYDLFLTNANAPATKEALESLELVIVQDMFLNETAKEFGSVFLPTASPLEKDGTFMNGERRVSRVRKVIEPMGEAKADWEILCEVARAMGKGEAFAFRSPEEIWDEIRTLWEAGRGITYQRMEEGGLQWPCPVEDHPGTQILHAETFPIGKRAALRRIDYRPTPETTTEEFPFLLITGRTLHQFNAGTMTMRTPNAVLRPEDALDISSQDAARLGLHDGDRVKLRSRHGEAILPLTINEAMKPGELFATFHTSEVFLNYITSPYRDRFTKAPEYKVTAVRIERV